MKPYKNTEGYVGDYQITDPPMNEGGLLKDVFIAEDGTFIGGMDRAEWYDKHNLKVEMRYPHGVAKHYNEDGKLDGFVGYTHRGAQLFQIGHRLFDENFKGNINDFTIEELEEYTRKHMESIHRDVEEGWYDSMDEARLNSSLLDHVPWIRRGDTTIETFEQAFQAAKNLSEYLS